MKLLKKSTELDSLKLVLWEKTLMPESVMSKDDKGKTIFTKTGKEVEYTTYLIRDSFGDMLKCVSKDNSFRTLEGELVDITLDVVWNDFQNKNNLKLANITKASKIK